MENEIYLDHEETDMKEPEKRTGRVKIESKYDYDDEVYFLNGRSVLNGRVIGIKGMIENSRSESIELKIKVVYGEVGAHFWVEEEDCFRSKKELINLL